MTFTNRSCNGDGLEKALTLEQHGRLRSKQESSSAQVFGHPDVFSTWITKYAVQCMESHPEQQMNAAKFTLPGYNLHFWLTGSAINGTDLPQSAS